jgi:hypothetical protein
MELPEEKEILIKLHNLIGDILQGDTHIASASISAIESYPYYLKKEVALHNKYNNLKCTLEWYER